MLLTPLQGLFHQDGRPVFQEGMVLTSHNVTPTIKNRLRTPRLVIIEFVLDELSDVGSAGQMLYLSLVPNYTRDTRHNIRHESIKFDLKNDKATATHMKSVSKKLKNLQQLYVLPSLLHLCYNALTIFTSGSSFDHAVVIVHTHSDDTTGDLFFTSNDEKLGTPLAAQVMDVSFLFVMHYQANSS